MFRVEREGAVAIVRIDSPPVNALSFARWRSLPPLIRELEDDAGVAMRMSQALASMKPEPIAAPCIAATAGSTLW